METERIINVSGLRLVFAICAVFITTAKLSALSTFVWQPLEIHFKAEGNYENPYMEVTMWVDLTGPGFAKRVFGFWDGGKVFKVRVLATSPGEWEWESGSNQPDDEGLNHRKGSFTAKKWSDQQITENPNRRGIIGATANGHALQYADGTPFFLTGDTWWAASTWRLPFKGIQPSEDYEPGPGISFEELISYRKKQKYNCISMIAAYPNWDTDELSYRHWDENGVCVRTAWEKWGVMASNNQNQECYAAKDMQDEQGYRSFVMLPDREGIPNYDLLNPEYFRSLDKKMRYLWDNGFIAFLEPVRRDCCPAWKAYFDYNTSYARFVNYIYARYGVYNLIFSGIHFDNYAVFNGRIGSLTAGEFNEALNYMHKKYGPPPFGQLVTTLVNQSTYRFFGHEEECSWLSMHSVGNHPRDHGMTEYIEELFRLQPPYPAGNLEPYYVGWRVKVDGELPPRNSERDTYFSRAQMYGSVLSGGLAGHVFGHGAYDCTTTGESPGERPYIWEALKFKAGEQMAHLQTFMLSEGEMYQDLRLARQDIQPNKAPGSKPRGLDGWAFMMRTNKKDLAMLYFENGCIQPKLHGFQPYGSYQLEWFDPGNGTWIGNVELSADQAGTIDLPAFPGGLKTAKTDWAAKLTINQ